MKKTGCLIIVILFTFSAYGQEQSERIKLGLFSAHPYNFQYLDGKVQEVHYRTFHVSDKDGKIVKGKPFTWSDAGGVLSRQHRSYFYNESGQLVKLSGTSGPNAHWTGVVHYENDRIENIYWLKGDTLMFNWDIVYPDNGNVERQWISVQNNEHTGKQVFVLDKNGHVVKEMNYNRNGELRYSGEYTRNEDGSLKTQEGFNAEGKTMLYISDWKCNEKGLIVSSYLNILGGEEVNRKSNEVEYEYDENGNWIKRFSRGEMLTERSIEYYD